MIPRHETYLLCSKTFRTSDSIEIEYWSSEDITGNDGISRTSQVVDNSPSHSSLWYVDTSTGNHLRVFEESDSESSVNNVCANSNMSQSVSIGSDGYCFESGSHDSFHNSTNAQESFQLLPMSPSLSINVIGNIKNVPPNAIATISCSGIAVYKTVMEGNVLYQRQESVLRYGRDSNCNMDNVMIM